ncbi:MAG: tRNA (adenosine(37)-N6)-dimethylallyltransferase MiaA [Bacteroidales bacterium]|nr:tRNA (adenosine(37)-N6)-dimethylallyltransferase MiaA [Bacteroidales bacterium]
MNIKETPYNLVVITGPTATEKTSLAAHLASKIEGEIISADSRQVYRKMDLGTGKDYDDYLVNGVQIPYHLVDIHQPGYKYNVFEFQKDFTAAFKDITQREKSPILCGGTGLYIEATLKDYKLIAVPVNEKLREELKGKTMAELETILASYKKLHNRSDTDMVKRAIRAIEIEEYYTNNPEKESELPTIKPVIIGVEVDRETRRNRITKRLEQRLQEGMVDEVQALLDSGISAEDLIYYGLEYKFITLHLTGKLSYDEMKQQLNTAIHQFAKRQMTWFRRMEKHGMKINWIDGMLPMEEKVDAAIREIGIY